LSISTQLTLVVISAVFWLCWLYIFWSLIRKLQSKFQHFPRWLVQILFCCFSAILGYLWSESRCISYVPKSMLCILTACLFLPALTMLGSFLVEHQGLKLQKLGQRLPLALICFLVSPYVFSSSIMAWRSKIDGTKPVCGLANLAIFCSVTASKENQRSRSKRLYSNQLSRKCTCSRKSTISSRTFTLKPSSQRGFRDRGKSSTKPRCTNFG
jgi:hypothetical protein